MGGHAPLTLGFFLSFLENFATVNKKSGMVEGKGDPSAGLRP
jgi:hypothetical protein